MRGTSGVKTSDYGATAATVLANPNPDERNATTLHLLLTTQLARRGDPTKMERARRIECHNRDDLKDFFRSTEGAVQYQTCLSGPRAAQGFAQRLMDQKATNMKITKDLTGRNSVN
ncbi:MAG: hypothetical protein M3Y27_11330, partial [Acidobacteriota bacterium]|nr:hypothetical protein [Acidobacteriota bacterium]